MTAAAFVLWLLTGVAAGGAGVEALVVRAHGAGLIRKRARARRDAWLAWAGPCLVLAIAATVLGVMA